jgi:DNA helicase-2/ATP-dependent DNA helicase PcrA
MRLDTYLDVDQAVSRYLELIKVAALIERAKEGQSLEAALPALNEILLQCATPEQREILEQSALDSWLRDTERDPAERPTADRNGAEPSLDPFIPRRGRGLMLSASDIDTYRICPLKYKFARVFRIPQEPTIHQRFGIVLHQVLERFHGQKRDDRSAARTGRLAHDGSLDSLMELFHASWRRGGFGDSDDELQFRDRAVQALRSYWERDREADSEAIWFERSFAFKIGPHLLRGRVDRVDRHPDGTFELIDYKTGRAKTEQELREDVQLSVYQMGARESWGIETSAQSYFYVLTGEKVPVAHSEEELERVRSTITEIAAGILKQRFEPTPSPDVCRFCDYRIICPAAEK